MYLLTKIIISDKYKVLGIEKFSYLPEDKESIINEKFNNVPTLDLNIGDILDPETGVFYSIHGKQVAVPYNDDYAKEMCAALNVLAPKHGDWSTKEICVIFTQRDKYIYNAR